MYTVKLTLFERTFFVNLNVHFEIILKHFAVKITNVSKVRTS